MDPSYGDIATKSLSLMRTRKYSVRIILLMSLSGLIIFFAASRSDVWSFNCISLPLDSSEKTKLRKGRMSSRNLAELLVKWKESTASLDSMADGSSQCFCEMIGKGMYES